MLDVKKLAEARAAKAKDNIGFGVESERKKAREAARLEATSFRGQNISLIAAISEQPKWKRALINVAAYCRVSTDDIDQVISMEYQKVANRDKIKANPEWNYVGTYVDDGFSGTNTDHRPAFKLMMKHAMEGKIDMIITKSVSRFARNLLDCIGWIEQLSKLNPPVRVYFEQENIDTLAQTSNIILFVLAMVAEEESHMKSEAMQLSIEWRFSRGRFLTPELFGYDRVAVPDGFGGYHKVLSVNEREANVVRWIFSGFISGIKLESMAATLTDLQIPTRGKKKNGALNFTWTPSKLVNILRSERYCGDVLARKTYTPNFKTHKARKNDGKKNKYYQPGHHEAIVSRAAWNAAQRILNSKKFGHKGIYVPIRIVTEGSLTGYISMSLHWAGYVTEDYYRASSIAMGLMEGELEIDLEKEHLPNGGYRIASLMDDQGVQRIARELTKEEQMIKQEIEGKSEEQEMQRDLDAIVKTYQIVSGDMFSKVSDPVLRIDKSSIAFNKTCIERLNSITETKYVEILFNPVERMLVVRPCGSEMVNAVAWRSETKGAKVLTRIFYEIMDWDLDYSYKIPACIIKNCDNAVLVFDMDNFIGIAPRKRKEVVSIQDSTKKGMDSNEAENINGIFYGPEDEEPQLITNMEEHLKTIKQQDSMIYGIPAFQYQGDIRGFDTLKENDGEWDMLKPARPLDQDHCEDDETVEGLLLEVINNPPQVRQKSKKEDNTANIEINNAVISDAEEQEEDE